MTWDQASFPILHPIESGRMMAPIMDQGSIPSKFKQLNDTISPQPDSNQHASVARDL